MKQKKLISAWSKASAILMLMALAWLTISTPFVYEQRVNSQASGINNPVPYNMPGDEDSADNSLLPGSSEEKTESNAGNFSEFLHTHEFSETGILGSVIYLAIPSTRLYTAFHSELLTPPPNPHV